MSEGEMQFFGMYRGKVLNNNDPDQLGRVRAEVYPMLLGKATAKGFPKEVEGIEIESLPWAVPAMSLFSGAGPGPTGGFGNFVVPDVSTFIWLFFEGGDIYQPVYFAEAQTAGAGLPPERLVNYPYTKVWRSAGGVVVTIDDEDEKVDIKVLHPTGTYIQIDKDGNIVVDGVGTTDVTSVGIVNISGSIVNLNP